MSKLTIIENAVAATSTPTLPTAAFDLISFITNAKNYGVILGGGVIILIGVVLLIVGVVFFAQKMLSSQQGGGKSWLIIVLMILFGGAFMTGGWLFISNIASGGQKTIEELGGGFILLPILLGLG